MNTTTAGPLADVRELTAYALSNRAACYSPDSPESSGASFLADVRDSLLESLTWELSDNDAAGNLAEAVDLIRDDPAHEIADGAVPIYTGRVWAAFVDLGAYTEDLSDLLGDKPQDMEQMAKVALYIIAERLVSALLDELEQSATDDEDDE